MSEKSLAALAWNKVIHNLPGTHLLQTWEWGSVKSQFGWQPLYAIWKRDQPLTLLDSHTIVSNPHDLDAIDTQNTIAAALILQRRLPIAGFAKQLRIMYVPKGPLLDWKDTKLSTQVLHDLQAIAKRHSSIFIKIDPDVSLGTGIPYSPSEAQDTTGKALTADLASRHWLFSTDQIQYQNTLMIDLTPSEEHLLGNMKQKTRYNIRLAERKGVIIQKGSQADTSLLYRMYSQTSLRDGFLIRDEDYYRSVFHTFFANYTDTTGVMPTIHPLIAYVAGEPVAALVIFIFARKAWYLYGMSSQIHREKMPNYLLQWHAMRLAKQLGCLTYDLWGAPNEFEEADPLWGVFKFKEGLGGEVIRHIGAWDYPVHPFLYKLYTQTLPHLLKIMRHTRSSPRSQI